MTNSLCVLCSPPANLIQDEDLDVKPFLNPTEQDTQLILTLCKCLDFSIDFNFNCRPSASDHQDQDEDEDGIQDIENPNPHRHDNNKINDDDDSSSCSSSATFSSPPSLFCRNCVDTLEKFNTLYEQMHSLGLEMSQSVSKLISSVILSSEINKDVEKENDDLFNSQNINGNINNNNNPILSHIKILKQQICTRFSPSVNVKKVKNSVQNPCLTLSNPSPIVTHTVITCMGRKRKRTTGNEAQIVNEVQKRNFHQVGPLLPGQRQLLPKPLSPSQQQKQRILLLPHPTEPTKVAVFIFKPGANGNGNNNSIINPHSNPIPIKKINPVPTLTKTPIKKMNPIPSLNLNPQTVQTSISIATETAAEPEQEPETDPLQLNDIEMAHYNQNDDDPNFRSPTAPPVRELTWDKLVKTVGQYQFQYRNKWPFSAVPGTPGYKCCCGFLTKNKEGILVHLQKHVPFVHWQKISTENPNPNPAPKLSKSKAKSKSESTVKARIRVTVDSTGNKYTYDGKWIFNKVPVFDVDTGEPTDKFKFHCETCGKLSTNKSHLINHVKDIHADPQIYMCDKCPRQFNLKKALHQHQMTHSNEILFICSTCGKGYRHKPLLKNHELSHLDENDREKFPCTWENCTKYFFTKAGLRFHIQRHNGQKFQCDLCGCVFNQNRALQSHIDSVHNKIVKFTCPVPTCKKGFYSRTHYQRHITSKWVHSVAGRKGWSVPTKFAKKKTETTFQQVEQDEQSEESYHEQEPDEPEQNEDESSDASESESE